MNSLERLCDHLLSPLRPLHGRRGAPLALPDNITCFSRRAAAELNRPQHGRALHHRHVLILALQTAATVSVDDRAIRLRAGEGLLILPFQFHDYIEPAAEDLLWLFVTFDSLEAGRLETLRSKPFVLTPAVRQATSELVQAYLGKSDPDLLALLLGVLLAKIRSAATPRPSQIQRPHSFPLIMQVNQMSHGGGEAARVKQLAAALGISSSHLRTCFRASCGISLGRHLRRQRLEKACGFFRLSQRRVGEIAELSGFSSTYSFSRAFRSAYGVSPLRYRHGK